LIELEKEKNYGDCDEANARSGRVSGGRRQKNQAPEKGLGQTIEKEAMSLNDHFMTLDGTWTPNKGLFEKGTI
jgi:hypothetical protein